MRAANLEDARIPRHTFERPLVYFGPRDTEACRVRGIDALDCRGYARVDMRMGGDGRLRVLELNPNPEISPGTGAARQAKVAGLTYEQFIEKIALIALGQD